MKSKLSKNVLLLFSLLVAILIMGIGYASINSITGEIQGTVIANAQQGVFITNVECVNNIDANLSTSKIHKYIRTMMQSTIELSDSNPNSEITYKVTVYNNSNVSCVFLDVRYDESELYSYDNPDIIFEIQDTGFKIGDAINAHETKDIYVTFKYKDGTIPENKVLNSYLNFRIKEPKRLVLAQSVAETGNYLGSSVAKNQIEIIKFKLGTRKENGELEPPQGAIGIDGTEEEDLSFDASANGDKSIMGYYTNVEGDENLYELTFLSDEAIATNENAQYLFQNLTNLKSISFENFSTFGSKNMSNMFNTCKGLTAIDVGKFDTSNVTNMEYMFNGCNSLTDLDVSNFDTGKVTSMWGMFSGCSKLITIDVKNFNTSNVKYFGSWGGYSYGGMFHACSSLEELDVSKWDTSQAITFANMFTGCSKLTSIDVSNFDTSKATDIGNMFSRCSNLKELGLSNFNTSNVTNMLSMFNGCNSLTNLDVSNFDTSKVTNMLSMFNGCNSLTNLDLSNFDTSNVTNMQYMFYGCGNLKELGLSNFNTSNVTNMLSMFNGCNSLTNLDLSNFDTSKVTNMQSMFNGCNSLTNLDLSNFDTSNVTNMQYMFCDCSKLEKVYVSTTWTTLAVTSSNLMFYNCIKITGGNGTTYNSSYIDKTYARIDTAETPGYFTNKNNVSGGVKPSEIFDQAGTNPDGLHIGDFVNYEAGTWTQEEINAIQTGKKSNLVTANGSAADFPQTAFQFGGFAEGASRNGNAKPFDSTDDYVKDASTGESITGWRIFDIDNDGTVTLISAGTPEDYYHSGSENYAYMSEYILTGKVNNNWSAGETDKENYQKRDWGIYINTAQKATDAVPMTKERLDSWYSKYIVAGANIYDEATFQKIYNEQYWKYQNMIDNYSYYWIIDAENPVSMYYVDLFDRMVYGSYGCAFGVRILITLSYDVLFVPEKAGTKTVTGGNTTQYGGNQTYNVWNIQ